MQRSSPLNEVLFQQRLAIQIKQVEGVETDNSLKIFTLHVFTAALGQQLEGQNLVLSFVIGHKFYV